GIKCPRVVSDTSRGCSPDPVVSQALWADLSAPPITMHDDYRPARLTQFVSVDGNYQAFEALKRLTGDVRNLMLGKDHWLTPVSCSGTTKGTPECSRVPASRLWATYKGGRSHLP